MMPRKRRRTILIILIVLVILVIAIAMTFLYITTDSFKSNRTLFAKYIGQNVENLNGMYSQKEEREYNKLLEQNKYITNTQVRVNYTENIGTSSENTENAINQLKLEVKGQTDNSKQYNYQDAQLLKNDEKVTELEYIQSGDAYGIRFPDLFDQYLVTTQEDDKQEVLGKVLYKEEILDKISGSIDFSKFLSFTEEERQMLITKYVNIINQNTSDDKFSKQKNQTIQIDGKSINVNAYVLTLTKEQMNHIYLKMLEEIKQDEVILSKIDELQTNTDTDLRGTFVEKIENLITDITRNNIGQEQAKIIVYENYHTTVRTVIQNPEYEITMDLLPLTSENYIQVSYQNEKNKKKQSITYKNAGEETSIIAKSTENEKTKEYGLSTKQKVEGNQCSQNIIVSYEDETNRVEASVEQEINIIDIAQEEIIQKEENFIDLSKLEEEQLQSILEQVNEKVSEETTKVTQSINLEDVLKVLKVVGLVKENQSFEGIGISETEKKRFNAKFEILQGENLDTNAVLNLIDAIKENFIDIEVVSGTEMKLKLDRLKNNEEVVTSLTDFMEKNSRQKYNVKLEYDETTGLVSAIVLIRIAEQ